MSKKAGLTVILCATVIGFASIPAQANLLTNGSFEDITNFVDQGNDTMTLTSGSTAMPGWTVVNDTLAWIGPSNPFGVSASNGNYFLDLTGYDDSAPYGGVTQTIPTSAGGLYRLTFDLGSATSADSSDSINASAGSTSQLFTSTLTGINNWETETLDFVATAATTAITLTGMSKSLNYIGLDNVSVVLLRAPSAVPEPSTLALLGAGLAGFGAFRRRKPQSRS